MEHFFEFYDDRQKIAPPDLDRKGKMAEIYSPCFQTYHDYEWTATVYLDMINHPDWYL